MRPIQARLSLGALRHNYSVGKGLARFSRVLAVVKANAYGHGVERVARTLANADGFGTLELDGAIRMRQSFQERPIVLLEGFFDEGELEPIARSSLATVVHHAEQLRMLEKAKRLPPLDVWFKVNTGMNRLGFAPAEAPAALERLQKSGAARSITLMTHFATAEDPDGTREAMRRFGEVTRGLTLPRSLANSAAIFAHPGSHMDAVRMGIALYGATPFPDRTALALGVKPVMTLASELIAVRELRPGDCVGYGAAWRCERATRIGVVACGYADGYPRHAPSGTPILVAGARTQTVGRVSMDMLTVDLGPVPGAQVGSPVILWGEGLPVDEVAMAAGTIGYELLCGITQRVRAVEVE